MKTTLLHHHPTSTRPATARRLGKPLLVLLFMGMACSLRAQTTWTGATSADWTTATNWSAGVPDAADHVTIYYVAPSPSPILSTVAVAKSVEVKGSLNITGTGSLTINGTDNNGAFNNFGTVVNGGRLIIGNSETATVGVYGLANVGTFTNLPGGSIQIDRSSLAALLNDGATATFDNAGSITIGSLASAGQRGLNNQATFTNRAGGSIKIALTSVAALANIPGSNYTATFDNLACATLELLGPIFNFNSFTNAGFLTVNTAQPHANTGTFVNNGAIGYPQGSPIPNVTNNDLSALPVTVCSGGTVSPALLLGGSNSFTAGSTWYRDQALTTPAGTYNQASNTFSPMGLTAGTYTLYFSATDQANSCSKTLAIQVTVNASPTASIASNNGPICAGGNAIFTVSGTSGATLTYTLTGQSGNQTLALNGNSQTITASAATSNATLTLVSVANSSCSQNLSATSTVTVNALPTASIGGNNGPICAGGDATFSVSGTSGATLTCTLTGLSGNQTVALNGNSQTITVSGATANAILTLVSVADASCSQNLSATSTVTVNALPTASIGGNNGPVCAGGEATFSVSGTSGATLTYTLTGLSGNQTVALNGNNQTITASGATSNATLTLLSVTKEGCSQNLTGTSTVTVNPLPTASIGGNNSPICAGGNASFTVSGSSGATLTYTLSGQSGNQTLLLNGGSQTITASAATANAILTLVSVGNANCSQNLTGTSTVTVNPLPTASIATNNGPICAGGDATFTVSGTSGATLTYTLTGQSGNQTLALNGSNQTITASAATSNATLTLLSVTKAGCSQNLTGSSTVTVNPLPTASIGGNNSPICAGGNASFTVSGSSGATLTYTLTGQSGNQTLLLNGGSQTITASAATANAILTLVSVGNANCSQNLTGTSTVTVNPLPTASIATNNGPICAGGNASFTVSGTSGATLTYTLTGLSGNQTLALNGGSQTITASGATSNVILALVSVANSNCSQNLTGTSTVIVNALPTVNAGPDQSVVLGFGSNCTNLTATPSGGSGNGYNYTWNPGNLSGQTVVVCPIETTTYTVTLTDGNGCQATDQVTVRVQDVRCGPGNKNVQICYYGVSQCVSEKIAKNYLKLGATLGACGAASTRIGYEPEATGLPLALSLKAYPNPVQDAVTVEVLSPAAGTATLEVLDITGRARQSRQQPLVEGKNEVELRLGSLPTGIYLIKAVDALGHQGVVRVSKQ